MSFHNTRVVKPTHNVLLKSRLISFPISLMCEIVPNAKMKSASSVVMYSCSQGVGRPSGRQWDMASSVDIQTVFYA